MDNLLTQYLIVGQSGRLGSAIIENLKLAMERDTTESLFIRPREIECKKEFSLGDLDKEVSFKWLEIPR